jgi:hypothetical protein
MRDAAHVGDSDAFGRDPEEDPLADMGWQTEKTSARTQPTETEETSTRPGPVGTERYEHRASSTDRRGPGAGCAVSGVVALVIAVFVLALVVLFVIGSIEGIEESGRAPQPVPAADQAPSADPPRGLERGSLLLRGNLSPALRRLEQRTGGRLRFVRVAADRVDVQAVMRDDRLRAAQATWDGETRVLTTVRAPGISAAPDFAWSRVDASAPRRLAAAVTRRAGRAATSFDYAVLSSAGGLGWAAFLKGGSGFTARADGSGLTRIGG